MLGFAALLERTPPYLRRVRNLVIASRGWDIDARENPYQSWYEARFALEQSRQDFSKREGRKRKQALEKECKHQCAIGFANIGAREEDDKRRGKVGASAFMNILLNVSDNIEILEVDLEYHTVIPVN
jgi:hypothetical protein